MEHLLGLESQADGYDPCHAANARQFALDLCGSRIERAFLQRRLECEVLKIERDEFRSPASKFIPYGGNRSANLKNFTPSCYIRRWRRS